MKLKGRRRSDHIIDNDRECEGAGVIANDIDRPRRLVQAWDDPMEVDQRRLALHCQPKADVVSVLRVVASVAVA